MKFNLVLLMFSLTLGLASCAHKEPIEPGAPVVIAPSVGEVKPETPAEDSIAEILLIASTSNISQYQWKNRGKAPLGYIKGMAMAYAQELCNPTASSNEPLGSANTDALAYYGIARSSLNTYAFLMGLGMRESSGKHCTGRDQSASNTSSVSAEAGMFQTSYDAGTAKDIMPNYKAKCFLEVFKENVSCSESNWKNYGSGVGFEFQKKSKECPTFAAVVAAKTIRTKRAHYGPINRKEVEFKQEAVDMLSKVGDIVSRNPNVCKLL